MTKCLAPLAQHIPPNTRNVYLHDNGVNSDSSGKLGRITGLVHGVVSKHGWRDLFVTRPECKVALSPLDLFSAAFPRGCRVVLSPVQD